MIQTVKLAKLILSNINVRKAGDDLIEQFAADISARGILQNLIVTPLKKPRGSFAVIAGSRRFRALTLLAERGDIVAADYDVPVLLLSGDDATLSETSLAENFQRLAMTPADECRAFQHFLGQNGDIDAVAKRFGITRRFIEGRLRLAGLAEPIFEALASGEMTLDMAKAYASTESHERQMLVWNSYGKSAYNGADTIRRVIANESMKSTDPVARLVGQEAYVAAGGIVDRDLFSDAGDRWSNPEIAQTLAAALMEAEAKRIGDEKGLAWIRPIATASTWEAARGLHRVNLPEVPASDEEEARLAVIDARLEVLGTEMENEDLDEAVFAALDTEYDALTEEANQIRHYRPKILPPELAPRIGIFLTLSQTGEMELDDDYYSETPLRVTMVEPEESDTDTDTEAEGDAEDGEHGDAATGETIAPTFRIEEGPVSTSGGTGMTGGTATVDPDRAAPGGKALSQVLLDQLSVQRRDVLQDGRVSLAYGLTTSEADTWWPTQFPDYPVASMPPIPGDWIDKSWRNDTAPCFQVCTGPMAEPIEMWIDYRDPSQREIAGAPRFSLYRRGREDELAPIYTGEDYDLAMEHAAREKFACVFAKALAGALSTTQWQTMRVNNRTITPGACASHDHIDANMVMHATWLSLRGANLLAQGRITDVADDLDFINAGWAIAKAEYLTATPEGACFDAWRVTGYKVPDLAAAGCETGSDDFAPRPGRVYEPGHIEAAQDGRWIVNISNSNRTFEHLIDAEGHPWRAYAAAESNHLPETPTPI